MRIIFLLRIRTPGFLNPGKMNRSIIIFYFIFITSTIFCQQEPVVPYRKYSTPEHAFGDFSISGSPNILTNTPNDVQFAGGLKISAFVCKRISFDTDLVIGRDYFHAGPGIIGIPLWLLVLGNGIEAESIGEFLLYGVFIALSAEHISYHIPVTEMIDISPYVSLLRYKYSYKYGYYYQDPHFAGQQFSYAVGVQMNKYYNRFVFSPYAEINVGYSDRVPGYNVGIYCGYYFMGR
jgi:hypothetical protein